MAFIDMIDGAMYSGAKLLIATKERGHVVGIPHSVDEFETSENRLGYVIKIDDYAVDTVFIDEISEITVIDRPPVTLIETA